jgi:hypothetical protein
LLVQEFDELFVPFLLEEVFAQLLGRNQEGRYDLEAVGVELKAVNQNLKAILAVEVVEEVFSLIAFENFGQFFCIVLRQFLLTEERSPLVVLFLSCCWHIPTRLSL